MLSYYPGWFDYAEWFFGGVGVLCWLGMTAQPVGRRRGFLKLGACVLLAIGVGFAGSGGVLFNLRAPHLTAKGELFDVFRHSGRGSSTTFDLHVPSGEIDGFHLSSAIDQIVGSETAEVEYQADSHAVLHIDILEGRYAGYEATGSDGMTGSVISLFAALILAIYGVVDWFNDGTGIPSSPNNTKAPDGDVDTKSMLNLTSHD